MQNILLEIAQTSLAGRLQARAQLVRHDAATRRSALFRHEHFDLGQASPLYWMLLQMQRRADAETKLRIGLQSLARNLAGRDHNAGFRALFLLRYWHCWGRALAPPTQDQLRQAIRTAIETCCNRPAPYLAVSYTNFWLIEATVYTLGGTLLQNQAWRRRGERMLREMQHYHARLDAMDEFFSPTYIVVDLVALGILEAAAASAPVKRLATAMSRHIRRHLERHCDGSRLCWYGPYSRAYPEDLEQRGSLLNLYLFRATADAGWLRGPFAAVGSWAVALAGLSVQALAAAGPTPELVLSHPRASHEQRRCMLHVHQHRGYRLASASAYREWQQTFPLTLHCRASTLVCKSLTMGHFFSAQDGGLVLAAHRPICTIGAAGRDDMLQNAITRTGIDLRGELQSVAARKHGGRRWLQIGFGDVTVWLCLLLWPAGARRRKTRCGLQWRRTWPAPQAADPCLLAEHTYAYCLWVSTVADIELPDVTVQAAARHFLLRARCQGRQVRLRFERAVPVATHWTSSGWAVARAASRTTAR